MQHRQTVVRYGHNNSSPSHLQRSGTSDLQRCCQTDDVVHAPLSSRNTSHVMNNRSLSVVSIYVQVISFCFYKLFSTVGPYPRVWPHDYRRVYGRMIPMGPFSVRGGIRRGGIRRAYTGVCPYGGYAPDSCHVHAIRWGGIRRAYTHVHAIRRGWYSAGIHGGMPLRWVCARFMSCSCNPTGVVFDGGGIRRAYTGVCPYGGYAPATFGVTGALFFELKKEKIRLSVPRALRAWHRSACRRMR